VSTTTESYDWTGVAPSWEANSDFVEQVKLPVTARMLEGLALRPGARALELGSGTGTFALRLADAVGPTGHVLATDAAAGMVELVRRRTADRPQVATAVADATDTGLDRSSYDAVAFRMGPMLLPEPGRGFADWHRVLVDGGRLAVAVWAGMEHNPWLTALGMAAMMHGAVTGGPPIGPGGVFSLSDPAALEQLAVDAGFHDVTVARVDVSFTFASAEHHFDTVSALAGPLSQVLASLPDDQLAAIRATAAELLAPHRTDDGSYVVAGQALVLVAAA
jgi:SAM-dependent methyltransferase